MTATKVKCLHPDTGSGIKIDEDIYQLFANAIHQSLKNRKALTFSDLVEQIKINFQSSKINFRKSVPWYAVVVKNDLQARGDLEVFTEKGKKWHKLAGGMFKP